MPTLPPQIALLRKTLAGIERWLLTPTGWQQVNSLLRQIDSALEAGDLRAVTLLNSALMLYVPRRVADPDTRKENPTSPAEETKELRNHLVHKIDLVQEDLPESPNDA